MNTNVTSFLAPNFEVSGTHHNAPRTKGNLELAGCDRHIVHPIAFHALPPIYSGLFSRQIHEINLKDLRNVSPGVPG